MLPSLWAYLRKMFELEEGAGVSHSLSQINAEVCLLIQPLNRWVMHFWIWSLLVLFLFVCFLILFIFFVSCVFVNTCIIMWHVFPKVSTYCLFTRNTHTPVSKDTKLPAPISNTCWHSTQTLRRNWHTYTHTYLTRSGTGTDAEFPQTDLVSCDFLRQHLSTSDCRVIIWLLWETSDHYSSLWTAAAVSNT